MISRQTVLYFYKKITFLSVLELPESYLYKLVRMQDEKRLRNGKSYHGIKNKNGDLHDCIYNQEFISPAKRGEEYTTGILQN